MGRMTTGIDKLVSLVQDKEKISIAVAAKELDLSEDVIEEWAEILAQQKVFKISYHFSKMYLEPLAIDAHTAENSAKKLYVQKEAFSRKIDATIKAIDRDTAGFDKIKSEFNKVQAQIKDELETISSEMEYLDKYKKQKDEIEKDINSQKKDYETFIKAFNEEIQVYESAYTKIIKNVESEEKKLIELESQVKGLTEQKVKLEKVVNEDLAKLKSVSDDMNNHLAEIERTEKRLSKTKSELDTLRDDVDASKKKRLEKFAKEIGMKQNNVLAKQDELVNNARDKMNSVKHFATIGENIAKSFDKTLSKKIQTTKILENLDSERQELKGELEKLKRQVAAFKITAKALDSKKALEQFEKTIASYERKEKDLAGKFGKLISFLKGE